MAKHSIEQGDRIVEFAQKPLQSALADGTATEILKNNFETLKLQSEALKKANYQEITKQVTCPKCKKGFKLKLPVPFDLVAKSMAYTTKVVDEVARLLSFVQGGPDSRPDLGLGAIFEALSDEQLSQVQQWIAANKREKEKNGIPLQ